MNRYRRGRNGQMTTATAEARRGEELAARVRAQADAAAERALPVPDFLGAKRPAQRAVEPPADAGTGTVPDSLGTETVERTGTRRTRRRSR